MAIREAPLRLVPVPVLVSGCRRSASLPNAPATLSPDHCHCDTHRDWFHARQHNFMMFMFLSMVSTILALVLAFALVLEAASLSVGFLVFTVDVTRAVSRQRCLNHQFE